MLGSRDRIGEKDDSCFWRLPAELSITCAPIIPFLHLLLELLKRDSYVFSHILVRNAIIMSAHKSHLSTPNQLNVETSQRRVVSTSRRPNVKSFQQRVGHGKTSHVESVMPKSRVLWLGTPGLGQEHDVLENSSQL